MVRLDIALTQRGMIQSRPRAKRLIQAGQVLVNGTVCEKPAHNVSEADRLELLQEDMPFVGRGGLKLDYAITHGHLQLDGKICMDIGASIGGFTDCMLQHGAKKVYAVDVGHNQLSKCLQTDSRVVNLEGTDIRKLSLDTVKELISFLSIDVSFISLQLILPAAVPFLSDDGKMVVLIKPQFEAGMEWIGKHGLVRSQQVHRKVLVQVLELFRQMHLTLCHLWHSPILGGSGNLEYLAVLDRSDKALQVPDVQQVVSQAFLQKKKEKQK
ncbi:MAG: TlyA family RNA methyltransferase [Ruminococcus sp.]|nr:TlyA family RNA methyltransferase [Ruminococcus sp.]